MFALVEFDGKEMAVVPLTWMDDNRCYWPPNVTAKTYKEMARRTMNPKKSWPLYNITKIHQKGGE